MPSVATNVRITLARDHYCSQQLESNAYERLQDLESTIRSHQTEIIELREELQVTKEELTNAHLECDR